MSIADHSPALARIQQFRHLRWTEFKQAPGYLLPEPWRHWVLASGSLTQRLIRASGGDFRVQLLRHHWGLPWASERRVLELPAGQQGLVREVALLCHDQSWVLARTLIPASTLIGKQKRLAHLGETPLGAYLFRCRDMLRGPMEIARLSKTPYLADTATLASESWGRRSIFYVGGRPLLVSEFFMPEILAAPAGQLSHLAPTASILTRLTQSSAR